MKVTLQHVTKQFPGRGKGARAVTAVNDFDFTLPDGKLVGLLGPSGCGKSTTLNLLCGLLKPTSGKIFFGDEDVTQLPAEHRGVGYTPIKDVAARQSISLKYVEKLMPALKNAGLLDSSHGIGGGYRLNRDPEQYDLWEILRVTEGELAPVSCLQTDASPCQRAGECRTLSVWQGYYDLTRKYFSGITLADLMAVPQGDNYVI